MAALVEVLNKLLLPDNVVRRNAEDSFNEMMKVNSEGTIITLFQVMIDSNVSPHIRKLSAVLLRRTLVDTEESAYFKLSQQK